MNNVPKPRYRLVCFIHRTCSSLHNISSQIYRSFLSTLTSILIRLKLPPSLNIHPPSMFLSCNLFPPALSAPRPSPLPMPGSSTLTLPSLSGSCWMVSTMDSKSSRLGGKQSVGTCLDTMPAHPGALFLSRCSCVEQSQSTLSLWFHLD